MLSIIIPAYNESGSLSRYEAELFPVLSTLGVPIEVIVVDDGSTDDTAALAQAFGDPVRVCCHAENQGLAAALQTGIRAAQGDLVVTLDGDLTFSPTLIAPLLARFSVGDVDIVAGAPALAGYDTRIPKRRVVMSKLAGRVYSTLLAQDVTSVSPILRLYRREQLLEVLPLQARGFEVNAELLFELVKRGRRVVEVPASLTQRQEGTSKMNYWKEVRRNARLVARMLRWRLGLSST